MSSAAPASLVRIALLATIICYLPHLHTMGWWLSLLAFSAIAYRLIADFHHWPLPSSWLRMFLILACVALLIWHYQTLWSGQFFIGILLLFVALKSLEIHSLRDLRVIILCNFYVMLTVILINQELWIFAYLLLGSFVNFAAMLKITAPAVNLYDSGRTTLRHVLLAIPISLVFFYLFPRITTPLWQVPSIAKNQIGFNEEMTLNTMNEFFSDDSNVMRITFRRGFLPTLYWRGLVLSHYDGRRWTATSDSNAFVLLPEISNQEDADYQILLEPHQKKWLFYQDYPVAATPELLFYSDEGLTQLGGRAIYQRFVYSLTEKLPSKPYLSAYDRQINTQLPSFGNPRLRTWSQQQLAEVQGNTAAFMENLRRYIHDQPYWYSLSVEHAPPRNQMDSFWFDSRKGYCEYYASAVTFILRAAGIPARIIVGYHGGRWNPVSEYLTVQQNDAHAWLEYWQEGRGWLRFDPIQYIPPQRIDQQILDQQTQRFNQSLWEQSDANLSWLSRVNLFIESAQYFWERWLLFYNYDNQRSFLRHLGLQHWDGKMLLQVSVAFLLLFLLVGSIWYQVKPVKQDPLTAEHLLILQQLKRLGIKIDPPTTFLQQIDQLSQYRPQLKQRLHHHGLRYEQLRLSRFAKNPRHYQLTVKLLRRVRKLLQQAK